MAQDTVQQRKVGILLGIGIFLMPYIYSWFTLRAGYSAKVRVVAFSWLAILIISFIITSKNGETSLGKSNSKEQQLSAKALNETKAEADLKLLSVTCRQEGNFSKLIGEVENISSDGFKNIMVKGVFRDGKGNVIASDSSFISDLLPSTKKSFEISAHVKGATSCETEEFKIFGGRILTITAASVGAQFRPQMNSQKDDVVATSDSTQSDVPDEWTIYIKSAEYAVKTKLCAISKCGGFKSSIVSNGQTKGNEAKILQIEYVEVVPGDKNKHKKCSYVHFAFDKDFNEPANVFASWSPNESDCSINHIVYGQDGKTFGSFVSGLGYSGKLPEK